MVRMWWRHSEGDDVIFILFEPIKLKEPGRLPQNNFKEKKIKEKIARKILNRKKEKKQQNKVIRPSVVIYSFL